MWKDSSKGVYMLEGPFAMRPQVEFADLQNLLVVIVEEPASIFIMSFDLACVTLLAVSMVPGYKYK
jgi:hypothetical protein